MSQTNLCSEVRQKIIKSVTEGPPERTHGQSDLETIMSSSGGVSMLLLLLAAPRERELPASPEVPVSPPCSSECTAARCDGFNIRFGKFCGVGYTGCAGEKPCDAYDACCEVHDACVTKSSVVDSHCHEQLSRCLKAAKREGSLTWLSTGEHTGVSRRDELSCTADQIVQTMTSGMSLASVGSVMMGGGIFGALATTKSPVSTPHTAKDGTEASKSVEARRQEKSFEHVESRPPTSTARTESLGGISAKMRQHEDRLAKMKAYHAEFMRKHGRRAQGRARQGREWPHADGDASDARAVGAPVLQESGRGEDLTAEQRSLDGSRELRDLSV
jgi:hypothetical protein